MSPADMKISEAVNRAALQTEFALLYCIANHKGTLEQLRQPFVDQLKRLGTPRPIYSRFSSSLDEFVEEHISDAYVTEDAGLLRLTPRGQSLLDTLTRDLNAAA